MNKIISDIKTAPYILNICRQPRTFVKWHAGYSAIVGIIMIIIVLITGIIVYFAKSKNEDDVKKKLREQVGGVIMLNSYILFVCLFLIDSSSGWRRRVRLWGRS